jgi:peptide chain release factor 3
VESENPADAEDFFRFKRDQMALDKDDRPVYLADSLWMLERAIADYPRLNFRFSAEVMLKEEDAED